MAFQILKQLVLLTIPSEASKGATLSASRVVSNASFKQIYDEEACAQTSFCDWHVNKITARCCVTYQTQTNTNSNV